MTEGQSPGGDSTQAWFWTEEWQAREREADADLAAGRLTHVDDVDALIDALGE